MPEPLIRRAGSVDAAALAAIGAKTFSDTFGHLYPPGDLRAFLAEAYGLERTHYDLADPAKASWVVEAEGRTVGYALAGPCTLPHAEVTARCGELKRIYLLTAWQGGGLGARLFAETMAWLQSGRTTREIWIGVWSENHGAQRLLRPPRLRQGRRIRLPRGRDGRPRIHSQARCRSVRSCRGLVRRRVRSRRRPAPCA